MNEQEYTVSDREKLRMAWNAVMYVLVNEQDILQSIFHLRQFIFILLIFCTDKFADRSLIKFLKLYVTDQLTLSKILQRKYFLIIIKIFFPYFLKILLIITINK